MSPRPPEAPPGSPPDIQLFSFVGAKNHVYFIGFLGSLLMMCVWMLWGGARYFAAECAASEGAGTLGAVLDWASCNAWMAWVMLNAAFHLFWVTVLTCCQLYLVVCLGMTTNEQLNRSRYRHFVARGGRSPFTRGPLRNCAEFFGCAACGLAAGRPRDWASAGLDGPDAPDGPDADGPDGADGPDADTAPMLPPYPAHHYV